MSGLPLPAVRFFLDANVLISASWKTNAEVAGIWRLERVKLMTSMLVMAEVQRNLSHLHQIERLRGFMGAVALVPAIEWTLHVDQIPELLQLPEKDRHVLAAAVMAGADYLITGDKKHFSPWFGKTIRGVRVEPPTNLLRSFHERDS